MRMLGGLSVFSILFKVADKFADTFAVGQGECYKRVACPEVRAEGGTHTRHRTSERNAEHIGRDWSGGRGGAPLLERGLGGLPQENFPNPPMKW